MAKNAVAAGAFLGVATEVLWGLWKVEVGMRGWRSIGASYWQNLDCTAEAGPLDSAPRRPRGKKRLAAYISWAALQNEAE